MEKLPEQFRLTITRGQNFLEWSMEEMLNAFEKELEHREAHNAVGTNSDREQERHERNSGNIKKYGQHHHGTAAALLANERRGNYTFCLKNHNHEDCEGVKDPRTRKSLARKYEAFVVPEICRIQNSHVEIARREYPHLKGIWFSDVSKCQGELEIDVLIGADYLWNFQTGVTKRGKSGEPVAIETELGWVLSGPLRVQDIEGAELAQVNFVAQTMNNEDSLESNVQKLWSFEGLGICEEDKVHEEFLDGISFTGSRYAVKLPWKESHDKLPDNYANSLGRMKNQLRRLKKEPALLTEYDSIIREQVEQGIVEPVAALEKVDKVNYLPHQAVIRKDAVTTKVWVVYDASSKECSRYAVKLPWKESHDKLPDNYANSLGRMKNQLRRLKKEPALLTEYDDSIVREQVEQGIVEPVAALEKVDK
ncbi:Hypothetical predicted protein, partial [Paramuricea clavata]